MPDTPLPVLIIGAGPTGLALALWLAHRGVRLRIIDQTADAAPFSRALGVQARTLEFYRQLGIADRAVDGGITAQRLNLWTGGRHVAAVPFANLGEGLTPYPFILDFAQDQHERLLIDELGTIGISVERNTELIEFTQDEAGVTALLRRADQSTESARADYLAGCDGARSRVREVLGIGFPGGTYEHVFYVADVDASGPAIDGDVHIDLDRADFLAVFAMKGAGHARLVGTVRGDAARDAESLTFADVQDEVIRHLKVEVHRVNWFSTYHVHHRVARRFRDRRAFLLGDAAHIHSPAGAQGLNTGVGDAVNLAWKLADVVQGNAGAALLDSYEPERIVFARRLVATTDRVFTFATRTGELARLIRTRVFPMIVPMLLSQAWVRRFLFRTVSQLNVSYGDSALSSGKAGRLRGGDRLPWIGWNSGNSFAPLASRDWQVHVYGTAQPGLADACTELACALHELPWTAEARNAGVMRHAIYLIRPDGYVALADPSGTAASLRRFIAARRNGFREETS